MAGESPDKSDKKQASGKAQGASDPRLAVLRGEPAETTEKTAEAENAARGAAGAAGTSGDAGAPEKPETATDGASGAKGTSGDTEPAESAGADGAADDADGAEDAPGEDRLRAAVAAWVAGKDDEGETEGPDATDAVGGAGADGDVTAVTDGGGAKKPAKAAGKTGDAKESGAGAEAASGADAGDGSAERSGADGAGAGSGDTAGAGDADEAGADGDGPTGEAKAADRAAGGSDAEGGPASGAGAARGGAFAADGEDASGEDDDVDRPTAVFTAKGKKSGAAEEPVDNATRVFTIAKSEGARKPGEKAEPEGGAAPGGRKDSAAEPAGKADADAKADAKGETGGKSAASGGSEAGAGAADKADAGARTGAKGKAKDGAGSGKKGADLVDPPTTAFRLAPPADGKGAASGAASSKSAKGADGRTGGAEGTKPGAEGEKEQKGAEGAAKSAGKAGGAERDAERTSQFVALKSDDTGAAGRSLGKTAAKSGETRSGEKGAGATAAPGAASLPSADGTGTEKSAAGAGAAAGPQPGALPEAERTRQEPLPPLDLLAQLTNTPPPPETTLRTVVRRFKIWTPLVILLAIIFVVVQSVRPLPDPTLALGKSTAFTFKGGNLAMPWPGQGQSAAEVVGVGSLGTSGPQKPVPTASVAKVMTAYVILRDHPLKKGEKGESITIDAKAAADSKNKDESRVPLEEGQKFSEVQMLQMLMIPSGNNAARQLARWDSGSEEAFVKKMNAAAGKLGMTKTTYTDPSGLAKTTVSTAVDQLKLAGEVMKNDAFRAVVATENVQIDGLPERLFNNNSLLTTMPYVVRGIKTGSSTPAGGAFMWAAYRTVGGKDQLLLGVTMDQRTSSSDPNAHLKLALDNSAKVITAAREALVADTVVKKGQVVGYVDDGLGGETPVVATKDLTAVGWPGLKATFTIDGGGRTVPHEAKAGTEVGVLTVGSGDSTQRVPVALAEDLTEPTFGAKLTRIG